MPKEWILNQATMRWGLNKKTQVGPVAELIRKCSPKTVEEWKEFYYKNAYPKEHLNVDFFIKINDKYIGLQIKPAGYAYITQIISELKFQEATHKKFTEKYGGKVFYIISVKDKAGKKIIYNRGVIEEIKNEIEMLRNLT